MASGATTPRIVRIFGRECWLLELSEGRSLAFGFTSRFLEFSPRIDESSRTGYVGTYVFYRISSYVFLETRSSGMELAKRCMMATFYIGLCRGFESRRVPRGGVSAGIVYSTVLYDVEYIVEKRT